MKKIIICMILLMATLLIITGCGNNKKTQGVGAAGGADSDTSGDGTLDDADSDTSGDGTPDDADSDTSGDGTLDDANSGTSGGEIPTPTFETYESYLKFIETADVPDNFVTYEMISSFGEFDLFICAPSYGYDEYTYGIIDKETGVELLVYIDHGQEITISDNAVVISSSDVTANDMRKLPNKEKGGKSFIKSGIKYNYINGNLMSVAWVDDGIRYTIFGDLDICSLDSSSALSKLLKLESVGEAIATVKKQPAASK